MKTARDKSLSGLLAANEQRLLDEWLKQQVWGDTFRRDLIRDPDLREPSRQLLAAIQGALARGGEASSIESDEWVDAREVLSASSAIRARLGFSPSETAMFVFSLKQPIFALLREELAGDPDAFADALWTFSLLLDKLGLYTTEVHQKNREELIQRQQSELLELSTPVVRLWDGILALPLIGTLDSERTQIVMESLLTKIIETRAPIAIIDITGVPTVDTLVAQHLLKTVAAARLMGADCMISGIRPQIAQTIVHLGVDLGDVTTKATLADAFKVALERTGATIQRPRPDRA